MLYRLESSVLKVRTIMTIRDFFQLPPSRRRQAIYFRWRRLLTSLNSRLRYRGEGVILMHQVFMTPESISIGARSVVWPLCRIEGITSHCGETYQPHIEIGEGCNIQQFCHITAAGNLTIGDRTAVMTRVVLTDIDHEYGLNTDVLAQPLNVKPTRIGRNCFIGSGAIIQAGTVLGDHCIVGANAVVRGTFADNTVIAGIPARVVKLTDPLEPLAATVT